MKKKRKKRKKREKKREMHLQEFRCHEALERRRENMMERRGERDREGSEERPVGS